MAGRKRKPEKPRAAKRKKRQNPRLKSRPKSKPRKTPDEVDFEHEKVRVGASYWQPGGVRKILSGRENLGYGKYPDVIDQRPVGRAWQPRAKSSDRPTART